MLFVDDIVLFVAPEMGLSHAVEHCAAKSEVSGMKISIKIFQVRREFSLS